MMPFGKHSKTYRTEVSILNKNVMGPLVVLFIWAVLFCIISLPLGLIGIIIAHFYSNHKNVEVKNTAWFFAPTVLLFSFVGLLVAENVFYGIITGSSSAFSTDFESINLNKKYELYRIDASSWQIGTKDDPQALHGNIQEILNQGDTIVFSAERNNSYVLAKLNPVKRGYIVIDSASTTDVLWNKYTKTRGIDRNKVYTCDEHYWRYRKYFYICALIFNIFLFIYVFRRFKGFWKRLLIEE